jgi:hypothetical protein
MSAQIRDVGEAQKGWRRGGGRLYRFRLEYPVVGAVLLHLTPPAETHEQPVYISRQHNEEPTRKRKREKES